MINWYIPLYLGVILLLYLFPFIASFPSLKQYAHGRLEYGGLSSGTNLLLSRLISGDLLAFALLSVVSFGILGGIGFTLMVLTGLALYFFTAARLKNNQTAHSFLELLAQQATANNLRCHCLILLGINLGNMLLQLAALKYLLGAYFSNHLPLIFLFLTIFTLAYAGLGGFDALNRGAKPQMFIVFLTTGAIAISVFLENGLTSTYLAVAHIPFQELNLREGSLFFFTGVIIITSQYLLDHSLWHSVYSLKPHRQGSVFMLTAFCVTAIPLGYSAITVYALSQGQAAGGNILQVLENHHDLILLNLFVITVFIAAISSYALNLFSAVLVYLQFSRQPSPPNQPPRQEAKDAYRFALLVCLLVPVSFLAVYKLSLTAVLVALGMVYSSFAVPFLHTLFGQSKQTPPSFLAGVCSLFIGIGFFLTYQTYAAPLICLGSAVILQALLNLLGKIPKNIAKTP